MLICCDCERLIEEDALSEYTEFDDAWGHETYITHKCCPYCGSAAIIETTLKCSCCGEYIEGDFIRTEDDRNYCSECCFKSNALDAAQRRA